MTQGWHRGKIEGEATTRPYQVAASNECCAPACEVLPMQSTILVPLDGSPLAEHALPYAERLARATSARLILCRALSATRLQPEEIVAAVGDARAYVQSVADQLAGRGSIVETTIPWGEPADEILEQVRSARADLVVMATHGRSGLGRWLYGSVADEVLRRASVPIFLVPPGSDERWSDHDAPRILVPLDGSQLGEATLGPARAWATQLGSEVVLVQVIPFPPYSSFEDSSGYVVALDPESDLAAVQAYLSEVAERLRSTVKQVRVRAELGEPSVAIARIAADEKANLIVMATHGRSGLARLVLGSIATGTLRRANVPLLLVRPAALDISAPQVAPAADRVVAPGLATTETGDMEAERPRPQLVTGDRARTEFGEGFRTWL
jgi:nucleotide-binding universal stress UspA family protein